MGKRVRILIIEDDLLIAEMLKEMLMDLNYSVESICKSYSEAIAFLKMKSRIDLVFLDINLSSEKDGIDIAKMLNEEYNLPFIFLSSYSDPVTIKRAVKTYPEAYLVKPFSKSELFSAIELMKLKKTSFKENFVIIKDGNKQVKLNAEEIVYVKSDKNYLEITTKTNRIVTRYSLETFLLELNDKFFMRTHRSFALNLNAITSLEHQSVWINDVELPLSRKYKEDVFLAFAKLK